MSCSLTVRPSPSPPNLIPLRHHTNFGGIGGQNNQSLASAGAEATLDAEFTFGLSHPIPRTFFSTDGQPQQGEEFMGDRHTPSNTNEPYGEWLDYVLGMEEGELPGVVSSSYGDEYVFPLPPSLFPPLS